MTTPSSTEPPTPAEILARHPRLHIWGNGYTRGTGIHPADFPAARQELLTPANQANAYTAAAWCARHLQPSKPNARRNLSSYQWKNVFEQDAGGIYVPNGVFVIAAVIAGLDLDWSKYNPTVHARESRAHPIQGCWEVERSWRGAHGATT